MMPITAVLYLITRTSGCFKPKTPMWKLFAAYWSPWRRTPPTAWRCAQPMSTLFRVYPDCHDAVTTFTCNDRSEVSQGLQTMTAQLERPFHKV